MRVSEVFGIGFEDRSTEAQRERARKHCPFRDSVCTKSSKTDPLGICTLSDGEFATALCPVRFLERDQIFIDAAKLAFGPGVEFAVFPEIRILKIPSREEDVEKKIGKVDFLIGHVKGGVVADFAAVEVQAVYFSGTSIRSTFDRFLLGEELTDEQITRRPDFRSSAQKRLIPQLMLKVPVFRRWGKKFFVVVDTLFLKSLPPFPTVPRSNSELTWLGYPIKKSEHGSYSLGVPEVFPTLWDDVATSLREGVPPLMDEITNELQMKLSLKGPRRPRILVS
jgi:hypothetical protein